MSLLDVTPVVPVVVIGDAADAVPIARALADGGVPMIELTLRTPCALEAIERIADEVPDITVGAGTIVEPGQAAQAAAAGARFLVSPGATESLLKAMTDTGLPHLPGAATVSEVLLLLERGYREMKFFPAEAAGGTRFLASVHSPRAGGPVLPHRRNLGRDGPRLPRAAQCGLRGGARGSPPPMRCRPGTGPGSPASRR